LSKHIFEVEKIQAGEPQTFNIPANSKVIVNHFQLKKDKVSRVEVEKIKDLPNTIFITLSDRDKEIGTVVTDQSYVLDLEVVDGMKYYDVRPAGKYDKEE
jgi:murein L,D-transpeptidase YafK